MDTNKMLDLLTPTQFIPRIDNNLRAPEQALQKLLHGNMRFVSGLRAMDSMNAHLKMPDLAKNGQRPFAVILTCSDSRSPVELIFDQGVGDLFVVRVAGNIVAPSLLASMEFAVTNFESPLILVLGHTLCGAIQATCKHEAGIEKVVASQHLQELVDRIHPSIIETKKTLDMSDPQFVVEATKMNVKHSMGLIGKQSSIIADLVSKGLVDVRGALLDLSTGKVSLIDEESSS